MADPKTTLRVQIVADLADIKQGLGLLRGELSKVKASASAGGSGIGLVNQAASELKALLPAIGLTAFAAGMASAASNALDAADAIGKMAQKTGANVQTLSVLRVAVHGSAEEMGQLEAALIKLAKRQDDAASGNKEAASGFRRLGISIEDVKSKDPGQLFQLIAEKFGDMQSGAEKAAIAQAIFGKSGSALIPILNDLANGGFAQAEERAKRLGLYLSDDMVAAADAGKDALDDLGLVAEGVANTFLSKVAPTVATAMADMAEATTSEGGSMMEILGQAAGGVIQTVTSAFIGVGKVLAATIAMVINGAVTMKDTVGYAVDGEFKKAAQRLKTGADGTREIVRGLIADVKAEGGKVFDAFAGNSRLPKAPESGGGTGTDGDPEDGKADKVVKGILNSAQLARDAIERQLKALDVLFADGLVSLADYYAKKRVLQEQAIDAEIAEAEAQAKTAKSSEEQSRALTKIVQLQRDRTEIGPALAREQAKAEAELAKQLENVRAELAQLDGFSDAAVRARLEQQYVALIAKLKAESDTAGLAIVESLINRKVFQEQLNAVESDVQAALSRMQTAETSISAQVAAGLLPQSTAEQQLQTVRQRTLEQLEAARARTLAYLATMDDQTTPEAAKALEYLQRLDGEIAGVKASGATLFGLKRGEVQDQAQDSLGNFFTDLATRAKTLKEAFRDLVLSFVQGLARMAAEALAKRFILSLFGGFGGGGGGGGGFGIPMPGSGTLPGFGGSGSWFTRHTGGIAGSGGATRALSWSPGAAIRYHTGGIAGMAPDEVRTILRRDEEVLTRQDPRHRWNPGGGGEAREKQPIIVFGERQLTDALMGLAGEEVVVHHVRNNRDGLMGGG